MDDTELDNYIEAGRTAKYVLHKCAAEIKIGVNIADIFDMVLNEIEAKGVRPSFPPNISLNECAAHDCASIIEERTFSEGDLVKLDIGTEVEGFIADTALSVDLGDHEKLCEASKTALEEAIKIVKPELAVSEIGKVVEAEITSYGYKPVINLTGHSLGKYALHCGLSIPNTGLFGSGVLRLDNAIAIEPFATSGSGMVHEAAKTEIFQVIDESRVRSPTARKIMKKAKEMHGLPFAKRWLNVPKAELAIPTLVREGNLTVYHSLCDIPGSFVSQHEHTIIVTEDEPIVTTR